MERESKFIVFCGFGPDLTGLHPSKILQKYLSITPEVRVRKVEEDADTKFFLTVKSEGDAEREEFEVEISESAYDELSQLSVYEVSKDRYKVQLNDHIAELDVFDLGQMLVEVEFESREDQLTFVPPKWFGKNVTHDPLYKNKNIARNGFPNGFTPQKRAGRYRL